MDERTQRVSDLLHEAGWLKNDAEYADAMRALARMPVAKSLTLACVSTTRTATRRAGGA